MSEIPRELNWVKELAACTVAPIFNQLYIKAQEDVQTANDIHSVGPFRRSFDVRVNEAGDAFTLFEVGNNATLVRFHLRPNHILAVKDGVELKITCTLNNEGRCMLQLNGAGQYELWQVRKQLCERLFFNL